MHKCTEKVIGDLKERFCAQHCRQTERKKEMPKTTGSGHTSSGVEMARKAQFAVQKSADVMETAERAKEHLRNESSDAGLSTGKDWRIDDGEEETEEKKRRQTRPPFARRASTLQIQLWSVSSPCILLSLFQTNFLFEKPAFPTYGRARAHKLAGRTDSARSFLFWSNGRVFFPPTIANEDEKSLQVRSAVRECVS